MCKKLEVQIKKMSRCKFCHLKLEKHVVKGCETPGGASQCTNWLRKENRELVGKLNSLSELVDALDIEVKTILSKYNS